MKNALILFVALFTGIAFGQTIDIQSKEGTVDFYFIKEDTRGTFQGVTATITFNPENLTESKVKGSVHVNTINTGNKTRDHHLMADDMFNEEEYPEMTFEATSIVKTDGVDQAIGSLTIKGKTQEETFDITVIDGKMIFKTTIHATDYGVVSPKKAPAEVEVVVTIPLN